MHVKSIERELALHGKRFIGGYRTGQGTGKQYPAHGTKETQRAAKRLQQKERQ